MSIGQKPGWVHSSDHLGIWEPGENQPVPTFSLLLLCCVEILAKVIFSWEKKVGACLWRLSGVSLPVSVALCLGPRALLLSARGWPPAGVG